jgi:putative N6-adenine-specific DNA methylase
MSTPSSTDFEIFLVAAPGLEDVLAAEAAACGFDAPRAVPGGVKLRGGWPDVWRANLVLRGAGRVLARIDSFQALDLDKLARRARRTPWAKVLRENVPVHVEATCNKSLIYHSGAAEERIADAIREKVGVKISAEADVTVMARLDNNVVTLSVDTSGELLHKRGNKEAVHRAPMRETMAALFLRQCGYDGREPVVDPMCGSGTFVIEAAEMAAGLLPGRSRSFAFEALATFDAAAWQAMRDAPGDDVGARAALRFYGSDRDADAITISRANAARAGVAASTHFAHHPISDLKRPDGPPGLVIVNPPYGDRIGDGAQLKALYGAFGQTMRTRFSGWRVGLITRDKAMAYATGLPFLPPGPPVAHGGLRVTLFQTAALA